MKTQDLFKVDRSARRLNEGFEKVFGKKIDLEKFDIPQLEDARNKLRTQISQIRNDSNFNENLENDAYHQAKFMLDAIVAELSEREEVIADAGTAEASYGESDVNEGFFDETMEDEDFARSEYANFGNDENYESIQGDDMRRVTEGEIQQASAIVTAKTMVDRVGRWIEELSGMENDTLLQLGDSIRDEMGQQQAKSFIETVAPAIQQSLESLKQARETLASGVRQLTGEEQPAEMLGAPPSDEDMPEPAGADQMNMPFDEPGAPEDEFAAAEPAVGGAEAAGREQRESIQFGNRLLKVLAG